MCEPRQACDLFIAIQIRIAMHSCRYCTEFASGCNASQRVSGATFAEHAANESSSGLLVQQPRRRKFQEISCAWVAGPAARSWILLIKRLLDALIGRVIARCIPRKIHSRDTPLPPNRPASMHRAFPEQTFFFHVSTTLRVFKRT